MVLQSFNQETVGYFSLSCSADSVGLIYARTKVLMSKSVKKSLSKLLGPSLQTVNANS